MSSAEAYSREGKPRRYLFGDFTLDVKHRSLWRGAEELILRPKSFDVLAYLVARSGELVTKSALMEAVWRNTAVTDNSLAQCMVEIRRALNDQSQQLIRTVARRGYVFAAPVTNPVVEFPSAVAGAEPGPAPVGLPKPWRLSASRALMVAVALLIPAVGAVLLRSVAWRAWRAPENQGPIRAVPLNSLPGVQRYPSFSPDGEHVAFTWTGPNQDNQDVYVQRIASGSLLRLTTDQVIDYNPVWSPDDRWIAFLRRRWKTGTSELRVLPALGGPERKVADIRISETYFIVPPYLTWCPDSKCLVVTDSPGEGDPAGLFVVSLETGEKSLLTRPQFPAIGDSNPAISSDGTWLVFRRQTNLHSGELYRLSLQRPTPGASADVPAGLTSAGEPQRLTPAALDAGYPTWMPGNKEILFSARGHLWRLSVMGRNRPAQLPFVGEDGIMPVVSNSQSGGARRLVYVRSFQDSNIWRLEFSGPGATASTPPAVSISSTRMDSTPQLSPDGQRVAFVSDRSGAWEIWVADPNGSQAVQLTFVGADSGAPCWSPDGEWIVFQSNPQGQADVYVIRAAGGKPRNLSHHPATESRPSFSRNGQWVYFTSNRTGQRQIWKVSVSGGDPVQVTNKLAFAAFESPDSAYLYYNATMETPSILWRQPVSGGPSMKVLDGVVRGAFAILDRGIYYVHQPSGEGGLLYTDKPAGEAWLQYFDFATRRTKTVARDLGKVFLGLSASRDGRKVFYSRVDASFDDLMLVDSFR